MSTRIGACWMGLLAITQLLGNALHAGGPLTPWWISFGSTPEWLSQLLLVIAAAGLMVFALAPAVAGRHRRLFAAGAAILCLVTLSNAIGCLALSWSNAIRMGCPVPFSIVISLGLLAVVRSAWKPQAAQSNRCHTALVFAGGAALLACAPLALMCFFGNTDYRRPADVAIVFGARAYADGRLSDALEDRIRTACDLYDAGMVKRLVLSGGPGDGPVTEAAAMERYALRRGVWPGDIVLDNEGLNTEATVRNTVPLLRQWEARRVLVVSHFYHLPRIKLAYEQAGVSVATVPARQARWLGQIPFNMAREVAAFWVYYFAPGHTKSAHATG